MMNLSLLMKNFKMNVPPSKNKNLGNYSLMVQNVCMVRGNV